MARPARLTRPISVRPRAILRAWTLAAGLLVLLHIACQIARHGFGHDWLLGLVPACDLNGEQNLPAWFSATTLAFAAALAGLAASAAGCSPARDDRYWTGLALLLALASADEAVGIHERWIVPLRTALKTTGLLWYAWIVPAAVGLVGVGAVSVPFARRLPTSTRNALIGAVGLLAFGALGVEAIGGWHASQAGDQTAWFAALATVEEVCELGGMLLLLRALLLHLSQPPVAWRLESIRTPVDSPSRAK